MPDSTINYRFPTSEEFEQAHQLPEIACMQAILPKEWTLAHPSGSLDSFCLSLEIVDWKVQTNNRIIAAYRALAMAQFYFDVGIPDDPWFVSPGPDGESVRYFPRFQDYDYWTKSQFDFFCDAFLWKLFASLDSLGQMMVAANHLGTRRPDFEKARKEIRRCSPDFAERLDHLVNQSPWLQEARAMRHDITHNRQPGQIGEFTTLSREEGKQVFSVGVGKYIPAHQRLQISKNAAIQFAEIASHVIDGQFGTTLT